MNDIGHIVNRQRDFFLSGKTLDVKFRKNALAALRQGIVRMEGRIISALESDLGKSAAESYMCEIGMTLSELNHTIRNIRKYSSRRHVRTPLSQFPARSYIIPEPYGNVLIMSPWNYPFLLCISPLVSAIAAGNTAVLKPSAYSPATSAVISDLVSAVFPEEYVTVIEGGRETNSSLLEEKFDYIFFTGSKEVGKIVMQKASVHLTPVTLELGGKSPVIVDRCRDLDTAARRIVFGKYLNCGQTCVAPDYILVRKDLKEKFLELCISNIETMFGKDALKNAGYGHIVNKKHFTRLLDTVADAVGHGGKVICGGNCDEENLRMAPTVIDMGTMGEISSESAVILQEEIFGPLMPVLTWDREEDVISYISSRPRPLATYIFSDDRKNVEYFLSSLHFGGGCVNDVVIHLATNNMPFGGVGESGMGNYHGKFGFETFSHLKSIVDKPFWLDLPMRYQPYNAFKDRIIRMFLK